MRGDRFARRAGSEPGESATPRERVAAIRFPLWSRRRAVLFLGIVLLLSWQPMSRRAPASRPARYSWRTSCDPIRRMAFHPDGSILATVDYRGRVGLGRVDEWGASGGIPNVQGFARAVAFTPDGRWIAVGRREPDVLLFPIDREGPARALGIPVRETCQLAISPDGHDLVVSSFSTNDVLVWALDAGRVRLTLRGHTETVRCLNFSPHGGTLVTMSSARPSILVWNLETGRLQRDLTGDGSPPLAVAISPDGRLIASSDCERVVRIRDLETGRVVRTFPGHSLATRSLAFSPDGRLLATASGDGNASLWTVADCREFLRLDARADILTKIAFSGDGRTLAAAGNDGVVRLWDVAALRADASLPVGDR